MDISLSYLPLDIKIAIFLTSVVILVALYVYDQH